MNVYKKGQHRSKYQRFRYSFAVEVSPLLTCSVLCQIKIVSLLNKFIQRHSRSMINCEVTDHSLAYEMKASVLSMKDKETVILRLEKDKKSS